MGSLCFWQDVQIVQPSWIFPESEHNDLPFKPVSNQQRYVLQSQQASLQLLTNQISNAIQTFESKHGELQLTKGFKNKTKLKTPVIKQMMGNISQINPKRKNYTENQSIQQWISSSSQSKSINQKVENQWQKSLQDKEDGQDKEKNRQKILQSQKNQSIVQNSSIEQLEQSSQDAYKMLRFQNQNLLSSLDKNLQILYMGQIFKQNWQQKVSFQLKQQHILEPHNISSQTQFNTSNQVHLSILSSIGLYFQKQKIFLLSLQLPNGESIHIPQKNSNKYFLKITIHGRRLKKLIISKGDWYEIVKEFLFDMNINNPGQGIYRLCGWVCQIIILQQINNKQNLWDRIVQNLKQGNIMLNFQIRNNLYTLLQTFQEDQRRLIKVRTKNGQLFEDQEIDVFIHDRNIQKGIGWISWKRVLQQTQKIYLNWNVSIYPYKKIVTGLCNESKFGDCKQYLLRIPLHNQDFQLRVAIQFHTQQNCKLRLYEYQGKRVFIQDGFIRQISNKNQLICSDVFIFQAAEQDDYFILTLGKQDKTSNKNIAFTLTIYSFIEIDLNQMPYKVIGTEQIITEHVSQKNSGGGLNSPFFLRNLIFQIVIPNKADLLFHVSCEPPLQNNQIHLILINDSKRVLNPTCICFQKLLNQNISQQGYGKQGFIQSIIQGGTYLLVLGMQINKDVNIKLVARILTDSFTDRPNKNIASYKKHLSIKKISNLPKPIKVLGFQWKEGQCAGPRRRYRATISPKFHSMDYFVQFFKNPSFRIKFQKGKVQLGVSSLQYQQKYKAQRKMIQMQKGSLNELFKLQPPALSLCLLLQGVNKTYKIIYDDAYYVPVGFGHWTQILDLQQGVYLVVMACMQQHYYGYGQLSIVSEYPVIIL